MGHHNHNNHEGENRLTGLEVAVIGMSGRFPGADSVNEFWENLKNGVESISFFTREEMEADGVNKQRLDAVGFVNAKGILENVEYFDSAFFGYTPAEAELMDPQMRIFYECIWWALENAGYTPDNYGGKISVVAGATNNREWEARAIISGKTAIMGAFASDHLIDRDFLSTRMAYRLNLSGPAITMKTACSSALVAVDLACRLLLTGQCDIALGGGVSVTVPVKAGYIYEEGMIRSRDGHVRTFDARSRGVVFSDGVGVVVLKRLEEAIADRDNILAVIKGSAINNDGSAKGSYSAPGVDGQAEVIRAAHLIAEVAPETIDYVETHGTGTVLGDPIEVEGLSLAFNTDKRRYCALGSLKSNMGHLDTAAGIAALIKTVMAIYHKYIPPSLHFESSNTKINFENSPFFVNTELREWKRNVHPRRAGVSSFGVGGTNVHVILEEAPERESSSESRKNQLILLSAKNAKALEQISLEFSRHLQRTPGLNLADAVYTLQVGRSAFKHRQMLLASTCDEAIACMTPQDENTPFDTEKVFRGVARDETRPVFMFSGQGSQYVDMGLGLYKEEPGLTEEMDRCFEIFQFAMGYDIKEILYPSPASPAAEKDINQTEIAQPVIFILEYALAKLLMKWGIKPHAMIGHSIGEYVAACLSGVFSLEDAIKAVALRGKLMQQMLPGSMLSIPLPEEELAPYLNDDIELAAVNAPNLCVLSGPEEEIDHLAEQLKEKDIQARVLHTSHAFHSRSMEPMLNEFEKEVGRLTLNNPEIPYISNLTGNWIKVEEAADPAYWTRHLRQTVRFADGLAKILDDEYALLIEVGPGKALSTFARQHPDKKPGQISVNLVRHPKEDISDSSYLMDKLGRLWLNGQAIDWDAFYRREKRNRVPLPLYPFQRQKFWLSKEIWDNMDAGTVQEEPGKKKEFDDWFYTPSWKRSAAYVPETREEAGPLNWLVFLDECGIGAQLVEKLQESGHHTVTVTTGSDFTHPEEGGFAINPRQAEDYATLLDMLKKAGTQPQRILHLWNLTRTDTLHWGADWDERYLDMGFYSLVYLAQAIGKQNISEKIRVTVFANRAHQVIGNEDQCPEKAAMMGPVSIIPQEFQNIFCSMVDLVLPGPGSPAEEKLLQLLLEEINSETADTIIAYRSNFRLVQTCEPITLSKPGNTIPRLREGGVYLITGGLGGIGLVLARYLAANVKAGLILTGRSSLPTRQEWEQWLSSHPVTDPVSHKIRQVKELEEQGARVSVFSVDVTDYQGMKEVLTRAQEQLGPINGVIHAAGLPGGGVIQLKTKEMADSVLLPKIKGTLVLDTLLRKNPLDFILLCSSINSVVPMLGQVDYFAANAFLDAYAYYKTAKDNVFTVSVNWDSWQEVGMAVEAAKQAGGTTAAPAPHPLTPPHPLLEEYVPGPAEQRKYTGHLALERNWPLNEHMTTDGKGLLPGTTYLEMARAAWENYAGDGPLEITSASFIIPMMVAKNDEREVYLVLKNQGDHCQFQVESALINESGEKDFHQRHVIGEIKALEQSEPRTHDLEEIKARCNVREFTLDEKTAAEIKKVEENKEKPQGLLVFGSRWKTTKWTKYGKNEGLTMFELPEEYVDELAQYKLHPALLDTSTGFLFGYASGGKAYIPFAYKRLKMFRPLPPRIISYSRVIDNPGSTSELLKFNVTIMDEQGRECVEVEEFTMLEVSEDIKSRIRQKEHVSSPEVVTGDRETTPGEELNPRQQLLLRTGIKPAEGVEAFRSILRGELPQVVVSTTNLPQRIEMQRIPIRDRDREADRADKPAGPKHSRPEISSLYVAPRSDIEKMVAETWEEQLGIAGVGIHDDFFELGGDSLKAITINGKIQKQSKVEIPLGEFFNKPTVKGLSEYILAHSAKEEAEDVSYAIEPVEEKKYYRLTSAQKGIFVLQQMEENNVAYNISLILPISGYPSVDILENIFRKMILRHETFRTSFSVIDGEPVQEVHENVEFKVECYESGGIEVKEIVKDFIRPFDLCRAPLLRAALVKSADNKCLLVMDIHHIISDGSSMNILARDFLDINGGKELPPLRLQYKDYSEWKNSTQHRATLEEQEAYWMEEFKGEIPLLNMPIDFTRPPIQSFAGNTLNFKISKEETAALKRTASEEKATVIMIILSIYYIMVAKITGQEDIIIGTDVIGRDSPDLLKIIGIFVNALALRNFPAPGKTFREFLREVRDRTLKAIDNQDYQFADLVERISLPRDTSRNPLFDISFTFWSIERESESIPGMQTSEVKAGGYSYEDNTSKFDLTLGGTEIHGQLAFAFEYCIKLFKQETIERFINYFKMITAAVMVSPDTKIAEIDIMPEEEKKQLIIDFNDTAEELPTGKTIYQLFEEQVDRIPDQPALVFQEKIVTFRQFDESANQLAHCLRNGKALCTGDRAAILMERSIELIITLMGVMKAGAAYVPLDPHLPAERLRVVIEDASIGVVMTQQKFSPKFTLLQGKCSGFHSLVCMDDLLEGFDKYPVERPGIIGCENLAYVMYTSGSSGVPKGVLVEHRTIVNTLIWRKNFYKYAQGDVSLQIPPCFFDSSVTDIFTPLLGGARLVLVSEEERVDLASLKEILPTRNVSHFIAVPAFYNVLLEEIADSLKGVKMICCAGEHFPEELIRKHFEKLPHVRIVNEYGPTENSVNTTAFDLKPDSPKALIGRPISNVQVTIRDRNLRLCAIGVVGEMCLSGSSLARGYLNRPEVTAEKFIATPAFSPQSQPEVPPGTSTPSIQSSQHSIIPSPERSGVRFYCTGDLARWLPDGNLEFLGRVDSQVKIRGIRVEVAEIENSIMKHKDIKEAVVLAREDSKKSGERYLYAYVVSSNGNSDAAADLKGYLAERLPEYMVPSYIIEIETIPLTPSGKINRDALPIPEVAMEEFTAPRNEMEEKMAGIWAGVLAAEKNTIGIDSDFFRLGGNSLKATTVASRLHKAFNVKVPLAVIFKTPTIRELSKFIWGAAEDKYVAIESAEKKEYYSLTPAQNRLYILQNMNRSGIAYNLPQLIQLDEQVDNKRLEETFRKLIDRHENLRTSFHMVKDQPVQKVHEKVEFEIEYYEKTGNKGQRKEVERVIQNFVRAFDLSQAPLLRVGLIKTNEGKNLMQVDTHHIISDGISNQILIRDYMKLYAGETLPVLKLQYRDYSEWLNSDVIKSFIKKQERFWLNSFKGRLPVLHFPTDYDRPEVNRMEGNRIIFGLDEQETKGVHALTLEHDATFFMVLLAIYTVFLARLSGQEDIIVGSPISSRRHSDLEQIIGMFVSTLPMRNYPTASKTFAEFLSEVRQGTLEALENQDYPFEELLEKIQMTKEGGRNPLFDVFFQFYNVDLDPEPARPLSSLLPPVKVEDTDAAEKQYQYQLTTSKFDLYLYGEERDGRLVFFLEYSTQLFKQETIEKFIKNFKEVISQVVENKDIKLQNITISHHIYDKKIEIPETDFAF